MSLQRNGTVPTAHYSRWWETLCKVGTLGADESFVAVTFVYLVDVFHHDRLLFNELLYHILVFTSQGLMSLSMATVLIKYSGKSNMKKNHDSYLLRGQSASGAGIQWNGLKGKALQYKNDTVKSGVNVA